MIEATTTILNETLITLKAYIELISINKEELKRFDNVHFINQNFRFTDAQMIRIKDLKKLNRKYQKEINEIIKKL